LSGRRPLLTAHARVLLAVLSLAWCSGAEAAAGAVNDIRAFVSSTYDPRVSSPHHIIPGRGLFVSLDKTNRWPLLAVGGPLAYRVFSSKDFTPGALGRIRPWGEGPECVKVSRPELTFNSATFRFFCQAGDAAKVALTMRVDNLTPGVVFQTDHPGLVVLHNASGPSHLAYATAAATRVRSLPTSGEVSLADIAKPWILLWFADSPRWRDFAPRLIQRTGPDKKRVVGLDIPYLVVFHRKPSKLRVKGGEAAVLFDGPAGTVVLLPLYGASDVRREVTARWKSRLPEHIARRCDLLAAIALHKPVQAVQGFEVRADRLIVTVDFEYERLAGRWGVPAKRVAPLPPAIALAARYARAYGLPLKIHGKLVDLDYPGQSGPFLAVEGPRLRYEISGWGKYLDETLQVTYADTPMSNWALARLRATVAHAIRAGDKPLKLLGQTIEGSPEYFGTAADRVIALAPLLRQRRLKDLPLQPHLARLVAGILDQRNYRPIPGRPPARAYFGNHRLASPWTPEDFLNGRTLYALWSYAHYSGHWDLIRRNWTLISALANAHRASFEWVLQSVGFGYKNFPGRLRLACQGALAAARMARVVGDRETRQWATFHLPVDMVVWLAQWQAPRYAYEILAGNADPFTVSGPIYSSRFAHEWNRKSKTGHFVETAVQGWLGHTGPGLCGDPTLWTAPWPDQVTHVYPELARYFADYYRHDFQLLDRMMRRCFTSMTLPHVAYELNSDWNFVVPFFLVRSYVLAAQPGELHREMLLPVVPGDPWYVWSLRALLHADGRKEWVPLE